MTFEENVAMNYEDLMSWTCSITYFFFFFLFSRRDIWQECMSNRVTDILLFHIFF